MGESVFSPLTRTRLDRIEVIANLGSTGPHTPQEIDMTAHHLRSISDPANIIEYSAAEMAKWFGGLYQAQAVQFVTHELTYLLVTDPMGNYIYRWPTSDTLGRSRMIDVTRKHLHLDRK